MRRMFQVFELPKYVARYLNVDKFTERRTLGVCEEIGAPLCFTRSSVIAITLSKPGY